MTDEDARALIAEAYNRKYPGASIHVEDLVRTPSGTMIAVVKGAAGSRGEFDEVCLINKPRDVRIFDGTGDLAHNLARLNADRLTPFSPTVVAAVTFVVTLTAVIASTWIPAVNREALQALTGILGLAAGFYFGNQSGKG